MPTNQLQLFKNPRSNRIQIGLDERTLGSLTRFSRLTGYPRSRVVSELLQGIAPFMTAASDQLEAAQKMGDLSALSTSIEAMLGNMRSLLVGGNESL